MRFFGLALGAVLVVAGCKTTAEEHMEGLKSAVEGYNAAFRWKNFERAASYLPNDLRAAFIASHEDDEKSLHVEGYRILKVDVDGETAAKVVVRVTYLMLPSITVQKKTLTQHWHQIDSNWILETEENSIREVDPEAVPSDKAAIEGAEVDPAKEGTDQAIEVTGPDGKVIRKEGKIAPDPEPESESEPESE